MVKMAMTTVMAGGIMMMGQSAMAAPAQPQVHVDSATKDMRGHVASKILDVKADKTEVGLISNIVYEQVPSRGYANVPMQMDILQPKTKEKKPAILFVTGGGFINANKDNGVQLRMHLAENGYVVGSINYRVAPTAKFPEPLEDVKAAIRYLKANADRFGIDPARVGIVGGSAGGYLTAMVGLDKRWLKKYDIDADSIAGLIPFSGQVISHFSYRKMNGIDNLQPTVDEENAYMWRMMKLVGHKETYLYEIGGHGHGPMGDPAFYILKQHVKRILGEPEK